MNIDILKVGDLEANCYLLYKDKKCLIIDPGDDENFIISRIRELELQPVGIITTHSHKDHTKYAKDLSEMYSINIYNYDNLFEGPQKIDEFNFKVIYTKGHTPDSICIYFEDYKVMFTGDFLFFDSIGRVDLPGGNYDDMLKSIEKIKTYPLDITLYPGHGKTTTLEEEMKYNKYLR